MCNCVAVVHQRHRHLEQAANARTFLKEILKFFRNLEVN